MNRFILLAVLLMAGGVANTRADTAIFAGGCFWCMEADFQDVEGVTDVVSGFTGGTSRNPTYDGDHKGHYEAVRITYDPAVISYQALLDRYWVNIDPFDDAGQFCDKGPSYRAALFVSEDQRALAEASRQRVIDRFPDQRVVTEVLPAATFYPVGEHHQDYYRKNPLRYKYYRYRCGRDGRLADVWGAGAEPST